MRLDYDLDADALYVTLLSEPVARTVPVEDLTVVDLAEDGRAVGIEVIGIGRAWPLEKILQDFDIDTETAARLRAQFSREVTAQQGTPKLHVGVAEPMRVAS